MRVSESEAREWYENYGISSDGWEELPDFQKQMIAVEMLAESWDEVHQIREGGIPEDAAILYFHAESIGLDPDEISFHEDGSGYDALTPYVIQNTTSSNVLELFNCDEVSVGSVKAREGSNGETYVLLVCEGQESIFE